MFCSNCGKEISDSSRFCRYCGVEVERLPEAGELEPEQEITEEQQSINRVLKVILIIVAIVCAVMVALLILTIRNHQGDRASGSSDKEQTIAAEDDDEDTEEESEKDIKEDIDFEEEAEKLVAKYFAAAESGDRKKILKCYHSKAKQTARIADPCILMIEDEESYVVDDYSITEILDFDETAEMLYGEIAEDYGMSTEELLELDLSEMSDEEKFMLFNYLGPAGAEMLTVFQKAAAEGSEIWSVLTSSEIAEEDRSSGVSDFQFLLYLDAEGSGILQIACNQYASAAAPAESAG